VIEGEECYDGKVECGLEVCGRADRGLMVGDIEVLYE